MTVVDPEVCTGVHAVELVAGGGAGVPGGAGGIGGVAEPGGWLAVVAGTVVVDGRARAVVLVARGLRRVVPGAIDVVVEAVAGDVELIGTAPTRRELDEHAATSESATDAMTMPVMCFVSGVGDMPRQPPGRPIPRSRAH